MAYGAAVEGQVRVFLTTDCTDWGWIARMDSGTIKPILIGGISSRSVKSVVKKPAEKDKIATAPAIPRTGCS